MHRATPEERFNLGQARRKQVARAQLAQFTAKARLTPALVLLKRSVKGRVPALVKLKNQRMMLSAFGYFRGAVPVMAADLATLPNTGITVQLCGDAHVRNLGAYAAEDGRLIFDINDFDETIRGPFEWDLKRMAASLVLAGREAGNKDGACTRAVMRCMNTYCEQMRAFAPMSILDVVRHQVSRFGHVTPVHVALHKAVRATPVHTLDQLTEPESGQPGAQRRFKDNKPILSRMTGSKATEVIRSLSAYRQTLEPQRQHFFDQFQPLDVAFKVVGTGSVGLRDYCVYLQGNGPEDALFLQVKEEAQSAYAPYVMSGDGPKASNNQGQRVLDGQRMIQTGTDIFLGYTSFAGRDYLVRQLCDHKASIELEDLCGDGLMEYAGLCGELLARGHARSGDAQQIAGYVGGGEGFAEAMENFGHRYADQTEKDWKEMKQAKG